VIFLSFCRTAGSFAGRKVKVGRKSISINVRIFISESSDLIENLCEAVPTLKALGLEEERLRMCRTWKRHGAGNVIKEET
jgi:hypothetical protein